MAHSLADIFPATITPLHRTSRTPQQRTMPLPERAPEPPVTNDGGANEDPQPEMTGVGWTQIPNAWLEALGRPDNGITLREMRWLIGLMRLTLGYHRTWIELTRAEISAISGYDIENSHRLVTSLVKAGLLRVERRPGKASRFALADTPPAQMTGVPAPVTGVQQSQMTGGKRRSNRGSTSLKTPTKSRTSKLPPTRQTTTPPGTSTGGAPADPPQPPVKLTGGPPPQIDGGYGSEFASDSAELRPKKKGLKKTLKKDHRSLSRMVLPPAWETGREYTSREREKIRTGLKELRAQFPNDGGLLEDAPRLADLHGIPDGGQIRNLMGLLLHSWPRIRDYWREQERKAERSRQRRRGSAQQVEAEDNAAAEEQATADAAFAALTLAEQEAALRRHRGIFPSTPYGDLATRAAWWQNEGCQRP